MLRAGLFNFSKGELGPQLHGRVDVAAYTAALRIAYNVTVLKYGGVARRMGMRIAYEIAEPVEGWDDPAANARLVPFEYSIEQTYALLLTQATMRPLAFGGVVLEDHLEILDISVESQAIITADYHGYADGDEVFLTGIFGVMGELLNDRTWIVVDAIDADHFRINADTGGIGEGFIGANGGETRVAPPTPPPPPPVVPPPYVPPPPPEVIPPGSWPDDGREGRFPRINGNPLQ